MYLLVDDACTHGSTLSAVVRRLTAEYLECSVMTSTAGQMIVKAVVAEERSFRKSAMNSGWLEYGRSALGVTQSDRIDCPSASSPEQPRGFPQRRTRSHHVINEEYVAPSGEAESSHGHRPDHSLTPL